MIVYKLKEDRSSFKAGDKFTTSDYDDLYQLVNDDDKDIYYRVVFDKADDKLKANSASVYGTIIYERELLFTRRELAERSIKEHKDDWLTYLGVEEKSDGNS